MKYPDFYNSICLPWGNDAAVFSFKNEYWKKLEILYNNHIINNSKCSNKIPKIIHQIWIGNEVPEDVIFLSNKIKNLHKDWEYNLWTEKNIDFLDEKDLKKINKIKNLGARSDVLRYFILEKFGGLYLDCDFVPVKNFSDLLINNSFIAGVCNPDDNSLPLIANGLIACQKNHILLKLILKDIYKNLDNMIEVKTQDEIFKFSGPEFFTKKIFNFIKTNNVSDLLIYPSTFFYPINYRKKFFINEKLIKKSTCEETYAIHLWNAAWFESDKSIYSKIKLLLPLRIFIICSKIIKIFKKLIKTKKPNNV